VLSDAPSLPTSMVVRSASLMQVRQWRGVPSREGSCEQIERRDASGQKRAQERPLHQVERELRARLGLSIQNR
jgi:hypothetical protein